MKIIYEESIQIKPKIKRQMEEFKSKHFGKYTIGIQIRRRTEVPLPFIEPQVYLQVF
jgi:hypothetical protein